MFSFLLRKRIPVAVSVIGAGAFAYKKIFPTLARMGVILRGVASGNGERAREAKDRFGFAYAAAGYEQILEDRETQAVLIATRDNLHAEIAAAALRSGFFVYVEKPLAIDAGGLALIERAHTERRGDGWLTVGYNRRALSTLRRVRALFAGRTFPVVAHATLYGAYRPPEAWMHDEKIGGGRLVSNVCHQVDALLFAMGGQVERVRVANAGSPLQDHFSALLRFTDGSVATLFFSAYGGESAPPERLEVVGGGKVGVHTGGGGHADSLRDFLERVAKRAPPVCPFDYEVHLTKVLFALRESFHTGRDVSILS